jgi:hypothetical protein
MFNTYKYKYDPQGEKLQASITTPSTTASTITTPQIQHTGNQQSGPPHSKSSFNAEISLSTSKYIPGDDSDDSDSSELEEGEIDERTLPPLKKPVAIIFQSPTRRFRTDPSIRTQGRSSYPPKSNFLQFQHSYEKPTPVLSTSSLSLYPSSSSSNRPRYFFGPLAIQSNTIQCSVSYSSSAPYSEVYPGDLYSFQSGPPAHPNIGVDDGTSNYGRLMIESKYAAAEQSLHSILNLGITYDDLLAEGIHPGFLDRVYSRLQSPRPDSSTNSQRQTPELKAGHLIDTQTSPRRRTSEARTSTEPPSLETDVENFLHALEPSIPHAKGQGYEKKRGSSTTGPTPKRRAFGRHPPKELVIDVSDDDSDDGSDDETEPKKVMAANIQSQVSQRFAKITDPASRKPKVITSFIFLTVGCG